MTLIMTSQHVHSKVITINTTGGSDNTTCCVDGECDCSSLSTALTSITNNTVINITSEIITLNNDTELGSSGLNNITITGNGATISCNNNGSVYCESCDNVLFEGITWDKCGDPEGVFAGLMINKSANVSLVHCTFQKSQIRAVALQNVHGYITVRDCNFLSNKHSSLIVDGVSSYNMDIVISDTTISGHQISFCSIIDIHVVSSGIQCSLSVKNVQISNNTVNKDSQAFLDRVSGIFSSKLLCNTTKVDMLEVIADYNVNTYDEGSLMYIMSNTANISINDSKFTNNTSLLGSVIYIDFQYSGDEYYYTNITSSMFNNNVADLSTIYVDGQVLPVKVYLKDSNFSNNFGTCLFLTKCDLVLSGNIHFVNNTADSGPALNLDMMSTATIDDGVNLQFVNNSAVSQGGAIFVELNHDCHQNYSVFSYTSDAEAEVSFVNNIAENGPNSVYFNVFKYCSEFVNSSDDNSIVSVPYQFNYSQIINGTRTHIPTDYNYTWLNVTHFPVVTSPHHLILYGDDIQFTNNTYFIGKKILGKSVIFHGIVLDYFDKPAEVTQFYLTCTDCSLISFNTFLLIDNSSPLNVMLVGEEIANKSTNITLHFRSTVNFYHNPIEVTLVVELVPCPDHPGYYYSSISKGCICYPHNVNCYEDYNEIKRGYWFGSVNGKATTSLCPNQYCQFDQNRKKTRDGYYILPRRMTDQCEYHRTGIGCGKCSTGHTPPYDSSDCISVDNCSAGMTVLVVALTVLYWIVIIIVTFIVVACLKFRISSGYVYGIIYYYSMVGILLNDNPYISDKALLSINIISGFAELTPKFLGQLCLVEGLSGIDQLFIHYCHAIAISLFLVVFVAIVNNSRKISVLGLIARNIIPLISLLLLLSYTSLTSTSIQLLRPLKFTDISDVYTYFSPDLKYFHGRHVFYGIVAVICELVIGIGLPVILITEPFLSRKFNLVTFKAFLDEFRNCYKDKYRWFAAYYLICRQLILLIVFINDSSMVFSLQILCLLIATFHMWVRPYKNKLINIFDGLILQLMVMVVTIGTSDSLQSAMTEVSIILVGFPLVVFCIAFIVVKFLKRRRRHGYVPLNEDSFSIR